MKAQLQATFKDEPSNEKRLAMLVASHRASEWSLSTMLPLFEL